MSTENRAAAATPVRIDFQTGWHRGSSLVENVRTLADLPGIFKDGKAYDAADPGRRVYATQAFLPVREGLEGGLFWATSFIEPGQIGDEYFMTKGHFHAKRDRGEFYTTVAGEGALLLMPEENRETRVEWMTPGSVHYIPGFTAHRVANIGATQLSFIGCWPSDAGYDYAAILKDGFSARLFNVNGTPQLIKD